MQYWDVLPVVSLGLPLNKMMFQFLIADKWGTTWQLPVAFSVADCHVMFGLCGAGDQAANQKNRAIVHCDTIKAAVTYGY